MKKVKQKTDLKFRHVRLDSCSINREYIYTFTSSSLTPSNDFEVFVMVDEPETLKEFCELHNMPKKVVVEWLIKNYKTR